MTLFIKAKQLMTAINPSHVGGWSCPPFYDDLYEIMCLTVVTRINRSTTHITYTYTYMEREL